MDDRCQMIIDAHPRFVLAVLPTPLDHAERLERALRADGCAHVPRIYIKRDDLLSTGLGGNKLRGLEFQVGRALAEGATDVVTAGRPQSNHCRLTAAACARAGLRAHVVYTGEQPSRPAGNLLLTELFGAEVHFTGSEDRAVRSARVLEVRQQIEAAGGRAHVIPVGGSDAVGAIGHVVAAAELAEQCEAVGVGPATMVLATATGGTQAGMVVGLRRLGVRTRVVGFAVAHEAEETRADVLRLVRELETILGPAGVEDGETEVDGSQLGEGYGLAGDEGIAAMRLLARTEGLVIDPTYTAKGMAGLLRMVRDGAFAADDGVIFVHTGGAPALFA